MLDVDAKMQSAETTLPQGTYIVEVAQPLGLLAAHMLEPEADDSLAVWNFFDPDVVVDKPFPVKRIAQEIPASLLTTVEHVEPTEQITLEHLYTPGNTVDFSGGSVRGATWIGNSTEYAVRRDEATFAIDAATGAMRPLEELRTLAQKLASLAAFDTEQARAASTLRAFSPDRKHALIPIDAISTISMQRRMPRVNLPTRKRKTKSLQSLVPLASTLLFYATITCGS